jgi:putative ABC transport system substrate-binding protein
VRKASDVKNIFLLVLVITLLALTGGFAGAQQTKKVPRIGYLGLDDPSSPIFQSFRQGLREVGYIEGQNIIIEPRFAFRNAWRFSELASELVRLQVDVIVARAAALYAARNATKTIPIVIAWSDADAATEIGANPDGLGGNVTGVSGMTTQLGGKWLELLKEAVPAVSRVAVLGSRGRGRGFENEPTWKDMQVVARSLRIELQPAEVKTAFFNASQSRDRGVDAALTWATRGQADALIVLPGLVFSENLGYIADLAMKRRFPSIYWREDFAEAGGLMAYGVNPAEQFRRAAYVVDKILKGAKPAELPLELPTQFKLVINLKTAKEIDVTIPPDMLMFADRVIK